MPCACHGGPKYSQDRIFSADRDMALRAPIPDVRMTAPPVSQVLLKVAVPEIRFHSEDNKPSELSAYFASFQKLPAHVAFTVCKPGRNNNATLDVKPIYATLTVGKNSWSYRFPHTIYVPITLYRIQFQLSQP